MKKIPIDECPAGPALDAAVAVAQGLHIDNLVGYWKDDAGNNVHPACVGCDGVPTWHPSGDIRAALKLWTELAENHYIVSVCYGPGRDGRLYASVQLQQDLFLAEDLAYRSPFDMDAKAETIPHAITRAYLKVHGIEFVEMPE